MDVVSAIWRVVVIGIVAGSLYVPVATGLVIVYRSSGLLNFAQGAMCFVGGYAFFYFADRLGLPAPVGILVSLLIMAVLGLAIHFLLVVPVAGKGPVIAIMVTIALGSVLEAAMFLMFGTGQQFLNDPLPAAGVHLPGNVAISPLNIATVAVAMVIVVGLFALMRFTRFGIAVRAVSDNALLAGYWGQNSNRIVGWTWALAGVLSTLAGIAYAMQSVLDSGMLTLGTLVFPAIILGGMDSLGGAVLGSLLLGITVEASTLYLGAQWSNFVVYAALLLLLGVRPFGLFGSREVSRL